MKQEHWQNFVLGLILRSQLVVMYFIPTEGLIMLRDSTWQIISEGWSGKVVRQVNVVVRKGSQNPQVLSWKE